jgi:hypothetical protein
MITRHARVYNQRKYRPPPHTAQNWVSPEHAGALTFDKGFTASIGAEEDIHFLLKQGRRAISVPLTPVKKGLSRSLTDSPPRRSGHLTAHTTQILKLIVRVRFSSPAPT